MANLAGFRLSQLVARLMFGAGAFMRREEIADRYPRVFKLNGTAPVMDVRNPAYEITTSGNTTVTFTGWPASGVMAKVLIIVTGGGAHTLTFDAGAGTVETPGGAAITAPASGETDTYEITSTDGGATVRIKQTEDWS